MLRTDSVKSKSVIIENNDTDIFLYRYCFMLHQMNLVYSIFPTFIVGVLSFDLAFAPFMLLYDGEPYQLFQPQE